MTGWLVFVALAVPCGAALWFAARPGRAALQLVAAALLVAAAGYAWQGHPALGGHPLAPAEARPPVDTAFADERGAWMERMGRDPQVLDAADALIRTGDPDYAVGIVRGALSRSPRSAILWMGLGNALVHFADGAVTPAARFAFERADALSPGDPAPAYFLALAYALSGDLDTADGLWRRLIATAPPDAPWRPRVAARLALSRRLRTTR